MTRCSQSRRPHSDCEPSRPPSETSSGRHPRRRRWAVACEVRKTVTAEHIQVVCEPDINADVESVAVETLDSRGNIIVARAVVTTRRVGWRIRPANCGPAEIFVAGWNASRENPADELSPHRDCAVGIEDFHRTRLSPPARSKCRHRKQTGSTLFAASTLVVAEEKQFVLYDRSADRASELIAQRVGNEFARRGSFWNCEKGLRA